MDVCMFILMLDFVRFEYEPKALFVYCLFTAYVPIMLRILYKTLSSNLLLNLANTAIISSS